MPLGLTSSVLWNVNELIIWLMSLCSLCAYDLHVAISTIYIALIHRQAVSLPTGSTPTMTPDGASVLLSCSHAGFSAPLHVSP